MASTTGYHGPPRSRGWQTKGTTGHRDPPGPASPELWAPPCRSAPQHHRALGRSRAAAAGTRTRGERRTWSSAARDPASSLPSLWPEARAAQRPPPPERLDAFLSFYYYFFLSTPSFLPFFFFFSSSHVFTSGSGAAPDARGRRMFDLRISEAPPCIHSRLPRWPQPRPGRRLGAQRRQ